jgi:hypothetical protein
VLLLLLLLLLLLPLVVVGCKGCLLWWPHSWPVLLA